MSEKPPNKQIIEQNEGATEIPAIPKIPLFPPLNLINNDLDNFNALDTFDIMDPEVFLTLNQEVFEEVFLCAPARFGFADPTPAQLREEPNRLEDSKYIPQFYYAYALYFPRLEAYLFCYKIMALYDGRIITERGEHEEQGEASDRPVTKWLYTKNNLNYELLKFLGGFKDHTRFALSLEHKMPQPPSLVGWYATFYDVWKQLVLDYIKIYEGGDWQIKQLNHFYPDVLPAFGACSDKSDKSDNLLKLLLQEDTKKATIGIDK